MTQQTAPLAIDAHHLVKRYKNNTAVNDLSLQVPAGETFVILGSGPDSSS